MLNNIFIIQVVEAPPGVTLEALVSLLSLLLEVIKKDGEGVGLLSEVGDDSARAPDSLLDLALLVEGGHAAPGSELLAIVDHDEVDSTLITESTDEALVLLVVARLGEAAEAGGLLVEGLGALVEPLAESIVHEGLLEDLLKGIEDGHLLDLDFTSLLGDNGFFSIRHNLFCSCFGSSL